MIIAEREDDRIWLWAEDRYKEQIKLVPGARWGIKKRNQWSLPISWAACKQLRGVFGAELQVGTELTKWAQQEITERVQPALNLRTAQEGLEETLDQFPLLYPFQRAGVDFLVSAKQALLGDTMGTGKTRQLVSTLRCLEDPFPCLVICPKSIKNTWKRELTEHFPGIDVEVVKGTLKQRKEQILTEAHVTVINFETAYGHSRLASYGSMALTEKEKTPKELNEVDWCTIIVDEGHRMKSETAKTTRAIWWLGKGTKYRYVLTGTPVADTPDDLWALLHFISPAEWPARTQYIDRYCQTAFNPFGPGLKVIGLRADTKDEFFSILDPRFRRMTKEMVLPQLPPKVREIRECEMSTKQAKAYAQMEEEMIAESGDAYVVATLPITKRLRLMQFSSAMCEINAEGQVRMTKPSSKIDELVGYLEDIGDNEPCVVFAQSRQLIEMACKTLEEKKISYRKIVGGMSEDERSNSERDFQSGACRVLLGTIAAAGEGITLTRSRHLVFLQRSDSMLLNRQAEDRIHRIGSEVHTSVVIVDFVAPGTVEEEQIESLHEKFRRMQEITRDKQMLQAAADSGDPSAKQKIMELEMEEERITNASI